MKRLLLIPLFFPLFLSAQEWTPAEWPVLTHYDAAHLQEIALPLGGIGTGTVSLGGRGELRDWEIMNVPAKHFNTGTAERNAPFFAIYVKDAQGSSTTTMLAGPLYPNEYNSPSGSPVDNFGLPRFRDASFDAAYPFGQVSLSDPEIPVRVRIKGFNPLVPTDADKSGLPVAVLSYEVTNVSGAPLEVSVSGSLRNFIGRDGQKNDAKENVNEFRSRGGLSGIYLYSKGVPRDHQAWGTIALVTAADQGVSYRTSSKRNSWNRALLNFWDDFSADGILSEQEPSGENDPMASLAVKKTLAPGHTEAFTFYFTWSFPNRFGWSERIEGNYYCREYDDAWTAAEKIVPRIPALEEETLRFVNALLSSSYPDVVKEAALYNLSVLRSQTVFRLPDGHLMGWEGVNNHAGSCHGTCTHVWNYEVATPFLFGELARSMRDVEFTYATRDDDGCMNFRADLPLSKAADRHAPAADGQMGCIMKAYREWQLSGDAAFLAEYWPKIRKALAFAWVEKGWDGNQDGVMEGSQHNTMDVNYFGPNPQMQFWYMGALLAGEKMALAMKDKAFARKCRELFEKGSAWTDAHLFNGEYYEHRITDPETFEFLDMDDPAVKIPDYQLGRGCLVDQLVGQYMAHICGLGYLGDPEHIRTTLESIMKYNYVEGIGRRFNNMRSFVFGDECALLMASWPHGRLEVPFPYFGECMTGFEYAAAVGMLYEGQKENGLKCIRAIRERFDGARRSPFNEPECGYHYARSMASWAAVLALSDFHYSGVDQTMNFTSAPGRYFWSNGYAYGICEVSEDAVKLEILKGSLELKSLTLSGRKKPVATRIALSEGQSADYKL
ncbi:MAG: hypothetical protein II851_02960 [Bacteroidales bacterium]|nr:hypothetical protein [Bacteroidales bacterium]